MEQGRKNDRNILSSQENYRFLKNTEKLSVVILLPHSRDPALFKEGDIQSPLSTVLLPEVLIQTKSATPKHEAVSQMMTEPLSD